MASAVVYSLVSFFILEPFHLVLGAVLGAASGGLLHFGAVSTQNRVLLAHDYIERTRQAQLDKSNNY